MFTHAQVTVRRKEGKEMLNDKKEAEERRNIDEPGAMVDGR